MHLLGISSYPVRWRRFVWSVSLLISIIALEAVGTLAWLLAQPSEPGSRVFLAYSLERWGLILFTSFLISIVVYILWVIRSRQEWTLVVIDYFEAEKRAAGLLVFSTIVFITMIGLHIGLLSTARTQAYYRQLLPLFVFVTLTIVQVWIFLLIILRQSRIKILKIWFPAYQEDQSHLRTTGKRLLISLVTISLIYLVVQVGALMNVPKAVELGDTTSYLEGAGMQLSDPAFFSERRPWGILLIYKLLGGSLAAIGFAQLAFSTGVWLFLAWMLVGCLRTSAGKLLGFVFTLGISLSPTVQAWNHAGLSESFSISTLIVILALFIGLLQRWKLSFFLSLIFISAVWVSIHEVNIYLGLLAAAILFLVGLIRQNYRTFLILSFCIAVMLVINSRLSSLYALPRWALPVAEVITKRILPMPEYRKYFSSLGMPVTPELMALSGRWAHSDDYAILNNLRLRPFSRWLFRDGKTVYTRFLIAHPVYALTLPLVNLDEMLAVDFSQLIPGYEPALPAMVNELFFPIRWFWAYLGMSVLLFVIVLWKQRRENSRVFWLILIFFIFSIPYLYLAWHGDALDLARHAAIANIQFHLGMWLLLIFYLDKEFTSSV
jgi:hypothetical protein